MILLGSWGLYHPLQPAGTLGAREHPPPPPRSLWDPPAEVTFLTSPYVHDDGALPRIVQPHDEEGHLPGGQQQGVSSPQARCAPHSSV